MVSIERRIAEMEHKDGVGVIRYRFVHVSFDMPENQAQAEAEAIALDEAERGPLQAHERYAIVTFGPKGNWIETDAGLRWQFPNGTLSEDPWSASQCSS